MKRYPSGLPKYPMNRQPAGSPIGGQFAPDAHSKKPVVIEHYFLTDEEYKTHWKTYGFDRSEADQWSHKGFIARFASKWKENGFDPPQALQWINNGFDCECASEWANHGFYPEEARQWQDQQIPVNTAAELTKNGFTPEEAAGHGIAHLNHESR